MTEMTKQYKWKRCNRTVCKVIHLNTNNRNVCSKLRVHQLEMTEKNLIILVAYKMTINHQNDETGKKRGGGREDKYDLRIHQERDERDFQRHRGISTVEFNGQKPFRILQTNISVHPSERLTQSRKQERQREDCQDKSQHGKFG